MNDVIWGNR